MSVLKSKRTQSKAEYVNHANKIYTETLSFLTRMSARYSRLIAKDIANQAGKLMDYAEMANGVYPSDQQKYELRREYLLRAQGHLTALDVRLTHAYEVMMQNPQGCFTTSNGYSVESYDAVRRLDNMAESLGNLIAEEESLLRGVLESDKKKWSKNKHSGE